MAKRADSHGPARARYEKARSKNGPARPASCPCWHGTPPCPCPCWKPHTTARHGHGPFQRPARARPAPSARSRHESRWIPSPKRSPPSISVRYAADYIRRGRNPSSTLCSFPFLSPQVALSSLLSPPLSHEGRNPSPRLPGGRRSSQPHGV
jgi:hypothetical protein